MPAGPCRCEEHELRQLQGVFNSPEKLQDHAPSSSFEGHDIPVFIVELPSALTSSMKISVSAATTPDQAIAPCHHL